jgi:hypothetical protein
MPDRDLMPPGRSFGPEITPPGGLEPVLGRARARRRAKAAAGSAMGGVAVVLAALVVSGGPSSDALRVTTPASSGSPAVQPQPDPSQSQQPAAVEQARAEAQARASAMASAAASARAIAASLRPSPRPTASPSPVPDSAAGTEVGPPYSITSYDATRKCDGTGPTAAQGWCSYYDGALSGRGGTAVELGSAVCRLPGQGTGTLYFDSGQQAEFDVGVDTYPASWTWSRGHHFRASGSTLTVAAGSCVRWHVSWDVVDDAGKPLAPGSYYLDARPYATAGSAYVTTVSGEKFTVTG